jgi:hypothetical protein
VIPYGSRWAGGSLPEDSYNRVTNPQRFAPLTTVTEALSQQRWRDGQMAMRWCAAGMVEASGQFGRVNGHLHLPALRAALERHVAEQNVSLTPQEETENAARCTPGRHRSSTELGTTSRSPMLLTWLPPICQTGRGRADCAQVRSLSARVDAERGRR